MPTILKKKNSYKNDSFYSLCQNECSYYLTKVFIMVTLGNRSVYQSYERTQKLCKDTTRNDRKKYRTYGNIPPRSLISLYCPHEEALVIG